MPSNHSASHDSAFVWFGAVFVVSYVVRGGNRWSWNNLTSLQFAQHSHGNGNANRNNTMIPTSVLSKWWKILHNQFTVVTILAIAIGCSYSRTYLGYHTTNQVLVGACLGSIGGVGWYALFETKLVRDCLMLVDGILVELERERRWQCCCRWSELKSNGKDN
jgi:hypothetical protein